MTVIEDGAAARFQLSGPAGTTGHDVAALLTQRLGHAGPWTVDGHPLEELVPGTAPLVGDVVVERAAGPDGIPPRPASEDRGTDLVLTVLEGPSCGRSWPLPRGTWTIGKDGADIEIADPALDPLTARLRVSADSVRLFPADGPAVTCALGAPFRLGDTVLRLDQGTRRQPVSLPPLPAPNTVQCVPPGTGWKMLLLTAGLPLVAGGLVAWLFSWWMILVFAGMSAVMAVAHWLARGSSASRNRRLLAEAGAEECARAEEAAPSLGRLWLRRRTPRPGDRTPAVEDGLPIRWGRGSRAPHVLLRGEFQGRPFRLTDAPVVTDAALPHLVSVPGPVLDAVLAGLLIHGARVAVRGTVSGSRVAAEWLAHPRVRRLGPAEPTPPDTIVLQEGGPLPERLRPHHVYVVDGPVASPGTERSDPFVHVEHVAGRLRVEVFGLEEADARAPGLVRDAPATDVVPDGLAPECRTALIAATADSDSGTASASLPLSALSELAAATAPVRWEAAEHCAALVADLGTDARTGRSVLVDFNEDGPHCVIGGTTGSGKSEFFRSMLLSLALRYGPRRLGLVLIDFKGAASFGPLARLPHVHRLVTDLDEAAVHRDLAYLQAELVRRERLFRQWGVADWQEYFALRADDPQAGTEPAVPELMICVDEFRMLVEALPEAMTRLLRIATVGRSLGIHLVMATQRPQGAISPDIRANVSLTVCLRVASEADSMSMLGTPQAARIPSADRGRAVLLRDGSLQEFRGRLADRLPEPAPTSPDLRALPAPGAASPSAGAPGMGATGRSRLEESIHEWADGLPALDAPAPVVPPDLGSDRPRPTRSEDRQPGTVDLGAAECPAAGWQGRLLWSPEEHGPLNLLGSLADQRRWALHLLDLAATQGFSLLAVTADRGCAALLREHGGPLLLGILPTDDPEFLVEGLRAAREDPRMPDRVLVLVQGVDRAVEELMRHGLPGEQLLEDFVVAVGRRWAVSVTAVSSVPRALRGLSPTTVHWGSAARADHALAHTRTGRDLGQHLALVEGPLGPASNPCGLLVEASDRSIVSTPSRGSGPRLRPFPRRLVWAAEDAAAPAPETTGTGPWPLLIGVRSPFLDECVLPVAAGETVGVAGDSTDCDRLLRALRHFNPWADFLVHGEDREPSRPAGTRPRIAVLPAAHDFRPGDHDEAARFLDAADAALVMFDPQRFLASRTPWAGSLKAAGHAVVLGQRTGIEASFRAEECPKSVGAAPEGSGILLSRAGRTRFMVAVPGPQRPSRSGKRSGARCAEVVRENSRTATATP